MCNTRTPFRGGRVALFMGVVCLSVLPGCSKSGDPDSTWVGNIFTSLTPTTPTQAALDAFDVYDADKRRRAISLLSAAPFGGDEPYLRLYRMMLGQESDGSMIAPDPDPTVRAAAVSALGMHGDVQDAKLIVNMLDKGQQNYVRWAAAKALQRIHNPIAVSPLISLMLHDEDVDVRMAAAGALGQYAQPKVFHALVGALDDSNYAVVRNAQASLVTLTGYAAGDDTASDWLEWAVRHKNHLFDDQQPYTYLAYAKPPTLVDKLKFWSDTPPPPRHTPTGLELAQSDDSQPVDEDQATDPN